MGVAVVIPAFDPDHRLAGLVKRLGASGVHAIIVVDDGSRAERQVHFEVLRGLQKTHLLRHAVNLGKGAALRTGLNYACCEFPTLSGVVTADADGQHEAADILAVGEALERRAGALVLGCRRFSGDVPLRSRVGNRMTALAVWALVGKHLSDTQTGLRGIPMGFARHLLGLHSNGYEFELDMLIACKHQGIEIVEQPIATLYFDGNRASHFNPLLDSLRIYFTLLRFAGVSLLTALLDNAVFWAVLRAVPEIALAQVAGRLAALAFNYSAVRKAVFLTERRHGEVLPRYLGLVVASGVVSYGLIQALHEFGGLNVMPAKITAESLIFIANFALQRDFVFARSHTEAPRRTDWDRYYRASVPTAKLTRRYTTRRLLAALGRYGPSRGNAAIVELGGANSCFLDAVRARLEPREYHVVDNNELGLCLLERRGSGPEKPRLHCVDVLALAPPAAADVVFSVGLIEHFDRARTGQAIEAHFAGLRPGGIAVLAFPTPTLLYRLARTLIEAVGQWRFPDERPLGRAEVLASVAGTGELLHEETLWPLVLTQHLMVFRKLGSGERQSTEAGSSGTSA